MKNINFIIKNVVSVGFEPTRIAPSQLECDALTTRPKHLINHFIYYRFKNIFIINLTIFNTLYNILIEFLILIPKA